MSFSGATMRAAVRQIASTSAKERNRKAKIYSLTPAGEQWLQRRTKQWFSLASVMNDILSSYVLSPKGAHP